MSTPRTATTGPERLRQALELHSRDGGHLSTVPRATASRGAVNRPIASTPASVVAPRVASRPLGSLAKCRRSPHPETYLADLNEAQREAVHDDRGAAARDRRRGLGQDARAHLPRRASARRRRASSRTRSSRSRSRTRPRRRCASASSAAIGPRARAIWILTFHAACGRILRREAERLGYRSNFTIYDQADQVRLVKACLEELERDPKRFVPRGIHTQISNAKNQLIGPDEYALARRELLRPDRRRRLRLYQRRLFASNAVDFDDMLMLTVDVLQRFPEAREQLGEDVPLRARRRVPGHEPRAVRPAQAARERAPEPDGGRRSGPDRSIASAAPTSATSSSSSATSRHRR